ncbi:hypothetical protein RQM65_13930 [Pricia sp. S334]|uniref:CAP-Gly protein n=1 Tax=Pricia mediterranea TaxID=3076079 RepID=A0ABU3L7P0_9FLAO|nr:hypothetical protein [Pricia sp. S334]MDT7829769.1 hypothetical protein [Pricia sp. S334]
MEETTIAQINESPKRISRISWGGVLAGTLTTLALMFLLNILGLGIGLTSIDPLTDPNPFSGIGTGTAIWWILSNAAALFTGGLVAARMSGYTSNIDGALHGFLAWALYLVVGVWMVTATVGGALNGIGNMVSGLVGGDSSKDVTVQVEDALKAGKEQAQGTSETIKQQMFDLINTGEKYNVLPADASEETSEFLQETKRDLKRMNLENDIESYVNDLSFDLDKEGNLSINSDNDEFFDVEKIKQSLAENTELSEAEIDGVIEKWETRMQNMVDTIEETYAEAKVKVEQYSEKATDAAGTFSIVAFLILLLGAGAALFGGVVGSPDYAVLVDEDRKRRGKTRPNPKV